MIIFPDYSGGGVGQRFTSRKKTTKGILGNSLFALVVNRARIASAARGFFFYHLIIFW